MLALDGEPDALGVDQAGMLDGVDPGADRGLDAVGAMRVGGDLQAPLVRLVGDRAKLVFGQLLLAGLGVAREDPAGGADLDHLGADTCAGGGPGSGSSSAPSPTALFLLRLFEVGGRKVSSQWPPVAPSA